MKIVTHIISITLSKFPLVYLDYIHFLEHHLDTTSFFLKKTWYRILSIFMDKDRRKKREISHMTGSVSFTQKIWAIWEKQMFHL